MNEDRSGAVEQGPLPLPVGDHEVMVVDVEEQVDRGAHAPGGEEVELSLVVLTGPLKGQVVGLRYPSVGDELLDLLGTHGILSATDQGLTLRLED